MDRWLIPFFCFYDWILRKNYQVNDARIKPNALLGRNVELTFFFCHYQSKINYFCRSLGKRESIKTSQFENLWKTIVNECSSLDVESWNLWVARSKTSKIRWPVSMLFWKTINIFKLEQNDLVSFPISPFIWASQEDNLNRNHSKGDNTSNHSSDCVSALMYAHCSVMKSTDCESWI
jgi:hypothetical protein